MEQQVNEKKPLRVKMAMSSDQELTDIRSRKDIMCAIYECANVCFLTTNVLSENFAQIMGWESAFNDVQFPRYMALGNAARVTAQLLRFYEDLYGENTHEIVFVK